MSKRHIQGDSGGLFQVRSYVVLMITTNKTGMLFWVMLVWATSVVSDGLTGSCSYPTMGWWANLTACNNNPTYSYSPNDNNCHTFPINCQATCTNDQRMRLTSPSSPTGISCQASGGGATVPPLWSDEHHVCQLPNPGGGCGSGSVCIAKQGCVRQTGPQTCPSGWTQAVHTYQSAVDTRDCSNCTCASVSFCTGAKFTVYDDDNCAGGTNPNLDVAGSNCVSVQNLLDEWTGSYRAFAGTLGGSCQPMGGGQPTGSVTPSGAVTLCCR